MRLRTGKTFGRSKLNQKSILLNNVSPILIITFEWLKVGTDLIVSRFGPVWRPFANENVFYLLENRSEKCSTTIVEQWRVFFVL